MKRLIFIVAAMLFSLTSFSQDNWERWKDVELYLKLYEIEVEVWYNETAKQLNFEDDFSKDFDDMIFWWGYLMNALEFMLEDTGMIFEDLELDMMVYSFFVIIDDRYDKFDSPNIQYDIIMDDWWAIEYFNSNKRTRQEMIFNLFDDHFMEWFPEKRKF